MTKLEGAIVRRGGATAKYWYETIPDIALSTEKELRFSFSMSAKGGGVTDVQLEIQPENFSTLLEAMCLVDRQAAMEAMALELSRQIATQSQLDEKVKREGANEILNIARRKFNEAPVGEDGKELTIKTGIQEIIREIDADQAR